MQRVIVTADYVNWARFAITQKLTPSGYRAGTFLPSSVQSRLSAIYDVDRHVFLKARNPGALPPPDPDKLLACAMAVEVANPGSATASLRALGLLDADQNILLMLGHVRDAQDLWDRMYVQRFQKRIDQQNALWFGQSQAQPSPPPGSFVIRANWK